MATTKRNSKSFLLGAKLTLLSSASVAAATRADKKEEEEEKQEKSNYDHHLLTISRSRRTHFKADFRCHGIVQH